MQHGILNKLNVTLSYIIRSKKVVIVFGVNPIFRRGLRHGRGFRLGHTCRAGPEFKHERPRVTTLGS